MVGKLFFIKVRVPLLLNLSISRDKNSTQRRAILNPVAHSLNYPFQDNQNLLQADPLSDEWKAYTEYIDHMILDGLFKGIKCSLQYLIENTETTFKSSPLFEVQLLVLNGSEMIFKPSLDPNVNSNFSDIVEGLIRNIYRIISFVNRVVKHLGKKPFIR